MADYYNILGIERDADEMDVRRAFRKLARKYHPDLNKDDEEAEAKFKEVNEAYEVLSNADNRKKYDSYGDRWKDADLIEERRRATSSPFDFTAQGRHHGDDLSSDLQDIFSGGFHDFEVPLDFYATGDDIFGRRFRDFESRRSPRKSRTETSVTISLEDAYNGTTIGAYLTKGGEERRFEVDIPPGVDNDSLVRVSPDSGTDMIFRVEVTPHPQFNRLGEDLYTDVPVVFEDAILGGEAEVRTLDGRRMVVTIPENSQNGQNIRLRGLGMPKLDSPEEKGDLYATVRPTIPKSVTDEQRELIERFRESRASET